MTRTGGPERRGWATALALTAAVLLLGVLPPGPLFLLPLLVLAAGWARGGLPLRVLALAGALALAFLLPGDALARFGRGWALMLGAAFLAATLLRPRWGVLPRCLAAVGAALAVGGLWLAAAGAWPVLDATMAAHFHATAAELFGTLGVALQEQPWAATLYDAGQQAAELRAALFPAMLALQSLAALALAAWALPRLLPGRARRAGRTLALRPLREFRFNDHLVWLLIGALVLVLVGPGAALERAGANTLLFMGTLYALRGLGVVFFVAGGASLFGVVFGALAVIFLYPVVLTAMLLVGVGDTWLDVRGRAAVAPRA